MSSPVIGPAPPIGATRRAFVGALLAGPVTALTFLRCAASSRGPASAREIVEALVLRIPVPDPLAIGRSYRDQLDAAPVLDALVTEVFGRLLPSESVDELASSFDAAIRRDFEAGSMVPVSGWVLSSTEARFCLLLALEAEAF